MGDARQQSRQLQWWLPPQRPSVDFGLLESEVKEDKTAGASSSTSSQITAPVARPPPPATAGTESRVRSGSLSRSKK